MKKIHQRAPKYFSETTRGKYWPAEPIKHIKGTSMNSVWGLFNIRLAQSVSREHMTDPNNEYRSSDGECCNCCDPLEPPLSCDLCPKWNAISKDMNFTSLPSTQYVSSNDYLALPTSLRYPRLIPGNIECFQYSCVVTEHLLVHPVNCPWTLHSKSPTANDAQHTTCRNHGMLLGLTWNLGLLTKQASTRGHWEGTNMSGNNQIAGVWKH
jgi:hypothetical protein